jgi:hypothetical protein
LQGHPPSCRRSHRGHLNADSSLLAASDPVATSKSCMMVHYYLATHKPATSTPSMRRRHCPLLQATTEGTSLRIAHLRPRAVLVRPPQASQQPPCCFMTDPVTLVTMYPRYHRHSLQESATTTSPSWGVSIVAAASNGPHERPSCYSLPSPPPLPAGVVGATVQSPTTL